MVNMKTLILLRGLPGAGKSTLAELLRNLIGMNTTVAVFSTDDYFTDADGNYHFVPANLGLAHDMCRNRTRIALKRAAGDGVVIVANTFTTESELAPYFEMAGEIGARVFSLIVENRHGSSSIHNVPLETMWRMTNRFKVNL